MTARRLLLAIVLLSSVAVAAALALVVTGGPDGPAAPAPESSGQVSAASIVKPSDFLDTYVSHDGRVVRTDQGGDTVSEGQAYGMLIALGAEDRSTFDRIWRWTDTHLRRSDGLLSWRFEGDKVVDESSAADADLDTARALVLAGKQFDEPSYVTKGKTLGRAILDHETVTTPAGLVLVAGSWATQEPYAFNPSYVSPVATQVLSEATGDPRWQRLEEGNRAAVEDLTTGDHLPPDWAEIATDGSVRPVPGPAGQPVQFGYDAARTLVRHAESCRAVDQRIAADAARVVGGDGTHPTVAVYDLAGSPQTDASSPLTLVAQGAGLAASGDDGAATQELREARGAQQTSPTYYGDAWSVLGPMLLTDRDLGGCPLLGAS